MLLEEMISTLQSQSLSSDWTPVHHPCHHTSAGQGHVANVCGKGGGVEALFGQILFEHATLLLQGDQKQLSQKNGLTQSFLES